MYRRRLALLATINVALAVSPSYAQTVPWPCQPTLPGGETWMRPTAGVSHAIGFTVTSYTLESGSGTNGTYKTVPVVPTTIAHYQSGNVQIDSIWKWNDARISASGCNKTDLVINGQNVTRYDVDNFGPASGLASLLTVKKSGSEDDCVLELGCDEGDPGGGGGGGGGNSGWYICYFWDYYDPNGTFLYREYTGCDPL